MKHIALESYLHQQYSDGAKLVIKEAAQNVKAFLNEPTYWILEVSSHLLNQGLKIKTDGADLLQIQIPQLLIKKTDSKAVITKIVTQTKYFKQLKHRKDRKIDIDIPKRRILIK